MLKYTCYNSDVEDVNDDPLVICIGYPDLYYCPTAGMGIKTKQMNYKLAFVKLVLIFSVLISLLILIKWTRMNQIEYYPRQPTLDINP